MGALEPGKLEQLGKLGAEGGAVSRRESRPGWTRSHQPMPGVSELL